MIPSVQYPVLKVPACGVAPAARSSAFVLGARLNNTRTPGPCPELFRLRRYLHILHTYGARRGSRGALRAPFSYEGFRARRVSGALRPSLHVDGTRTEREGVAPSMPAMPLYIDATRDGAPHDAVRGASRHGAGASRRETGRFMSRRLAPWQAAQRRAGLGEHRRCTGRGLGSDAEYRSALRVDPRRRPLIITCFGFDALGPLFR